MRRTLRAATRLVVVLLAALIAAPQAIAAPVPAESQSAAAPSAPGGLAKESRKVSPRGTVDLSEATARPSMPRPTKDKPLLAAPASAGGTPRGPNGLAPKPLVPGPAPAMATTIATHPPIVTPTFNGLAHGTPDTNFEPPDPWLAVGPNHIVQVVNTAIRVTNRQGGHIKTAALADFFQIPLDPERFNFDPRVIYDSLHGRWIVSETSFDCAPDFDPAFVGYGYLDIAVSDTADPLGDWTIYWIPFPDVLPDYPMVGTSTDKIAIGSNVFYLQPGGPDGCFPDAYVEGAIDVIDWDQIGDDLNYIHVFSDQHSTFRPALQVPATSPAIHAIAGTGSVEGDTHVEYLEITGTASPDTINVTTDDLTATNKIGAFGDPPAPRQPTEPSGPIPHDGKIANAVDGRPTDALWQNGRLVWGSTIGCMPEGDPIERDCVRVSELNTTTVQRRQDFLIGQLGYDIFHGGIGLSMNGALHVTYTRSSTIESPGTHAVYQLPGDPTNAVSPDELVRAAAGPYTIGERWGDYTGVAQDPQDPNVVWQTNEVSIGAWITHISSLSTAVGGTYVPITPERVLDTRYNIGLSSRFAHGSARSWQVTGTGSIPANAVAVTGNVTVVAQTGAGHVSVTPRPTNTPFSSTINFPVGDVRANNITIPLSPTGKLSAVYIASAGKLTHLAFDVTGYFRANDLGATYNAVTPDRVLDTRFGIGLAGKYQRDLPRSFQVSGTDEVPLGAVAVTGNLTVAGQTAAGHVSLTPNPAANPSTSTINFPFGDNRANGLTIPLSASGKISAVYKSLVVNSTTHLIFDVTGYYLPGTTGLRFYPLNPGRRMDTRTTVLTGLNGRFTANASRVLDTAGFMGVPANAEAITGNLTVTQPNKPGHLAITPSVIPNPLTSTINFPASDTRANGVTQPLNGSGDMAIYFKAAAGGTVHAILDITGYFR